MRRAADLIEELDEEVRHLRRELGYDGSAKARATVARHFRLTGKEADIFCALRHANGAFLNRDRLMSLLYSDAIEEPEVKIIDVFLCKLRKKIGPESLSTRWGFGYALTEVGIQKFDDALHERAA